MILLIVGSLLPLLMEVVVKAPSPARGCRKSPLSSRERVGVRGTKINKLLFYMLLS
jgi:hypothetical protein